MYVLVFCTIQTNTAFATWCMISDLVIAIDESYLAEMQGYISSPSIFPHNI